MKQKNDKQKALEFVKELEELRGKQKQLAKQYKNNYSKADGFLARLQLKRRYNRMRDKVDSYADEVSDQYIDFLKAHGKKKVDKKDYLKYKNGIQSKSYINELFDDEQKKSS